MRTKRNLIIAIALLLLFSGCAVQTEKVPQYSELDFASVKELPRPKIRSFTLDNGIQCFLLPDHELPLVNIYLRVKSGKIEVPRGKEGLGDVLAKVMRSGGSSKYPGQELNKILENNAAELNISWGQASAKASLKVLKKDLPELLPVFVDVLKNPVFPREKIILAKKKLKTRIARRNDKQKNIAIRKFKKLVYGKSSDYARVPENESVKSITRTDLEKFHKSAFKGRKMILGIVGDFDPERIKSRVKKAFSIFPPGSSSEKEFAKSFLRVKPNKKRTLNLVPKSDVNQSFIMIGHLGGFRTNPDYASIQVMNKILSGGFSGRLFENIRTRQGLAYAVFGRYGCNYFYPGMFFVGLKTKTSRTREAILEVQKQIKRLQKSGVTRQELEQAQSQFNNALVFRYKSPNKIISRRLYYEYRNMSPDSLQRLIGQIREVSASEVQDIAREYIHPQRFQILVVGKKSELYPQLQKLGAVNTIELD